MSISMFVVYYLYSNFQYVIEISAWWTIKSVIIISPLFIAKKEPFFVRVLIDGRQMLTVLTHELKHIHSVSWSWWYSTINNNFWFGACLWGSRVVSIPYILPHHCNNIWLQSLWRHKRNKLWCDVYMQSGGWRGSATGQFNRTDIGKCC